MPYPVVSRKVSPKGFDRGELPLAQRVIMNLSTKPGFNTTEMSQTFNQNTFDQTHTSMRYSTLSKRSHHGRSVDSEAHVTGQSFAQPNNGWFENESRCVQAYYYTRAFQPFEEKSIKVKKDRENQLRKERGVTGPPE